MKNQRRCSGVEYSLRMLSTVILLQQARLNESDSVQSNQKHQGELSKVSG
jgi:hypothetical protein